MRHLVNTSTQLPPLGKTLSTPAGRCRLEASRCLSAATTLAEYHPHSNETPHYILLFHSIELGLKAYLLKAGMELKELRNRRYGHNLCALYKEAVRNGLVLDDPKTGPLIEWINEWHQNAGIRYDFDAERTLPVCAELSPLAAAIISANE